MLKSRALSTRSSHWDFVHQGKEVAELGTVLIAADGSIYIEVPALYACHSSPVHARVIESLNRIGSTAAGSIVPHLIRSVPTDPDRGLFLESDTYEMLVGRLIRRSGRADEVIATCLALLGDPAAKATSELQQTMELTFNAWAGKPSVENRVVQILSAVCRDRRHEPVVRAVYERYRAMPEELPDRTLGAQKVWHVTSYAAAKALGGIANPKSIPALRSLAEH